MVASVKTRVWIVVGALVAALTIFSSAEAEHHEPRLIIFGDSLSTTLKSWPNHLRRIAPRWNIHLMAQNGRTIRDFSIPRDLWTPGDRNETVIYFLGGNDILQRNNVNHAKYRLQSHINFLLERNFKVLLIVPPHLGLDEETFGKSNEEHRAMVESCRGIHPNLWVYDMDNVWDPSQTHDGIHPTSNLSYEIALVINMVLAVNIY